MMAMIWIGSDFTQKTLNFQQNTWLLHKKHNFVTMQKLNYLHSTPIKEIMVFFDENDNKVCAATQFKHVVDK